MARTEIQRDGTYKTATIAISSSTSSAIPITGKVILGLVVPSAITGTAFTFTVSHDGTTYQALYDTTNTQVSLTVAASRNYDLPSELASWPYFKIVSNGTEAAARTLYVTMKG